MNIALLMASASFVQLHFLCAVAALALGAVQLVSRKGTLWHKVSGRAWVLMMLFISGTSFMIKTIMPNGPLWGYSPIHVLSVYVIVQVVRGIHFARVGDIERHRKCMAYTYLGGLIVAGAFAFMPGRLLHAVFLAPQIHF